MSEFIFKDLTVHFEEYGSGETIIILNGVFMSTASWIPFIPSFSKSNHLILVDFIDQGRTSRASFEYTQEIQVELLYALLEHLSIDSANFVGVSYGGEVLQQFAIKYPERVKKLVLSNTTAYTNPWLSESGKSWEYAINSHDGSQFFKTCIPIIYSPDFYNKNLEWAKNREALFIKYFTPEVYDAFGRLVRSAEKHDTRESISQITAETLIISSEYDYITPIPNQDFIVSKIKNSSHVLIKNAGHACMYEKPKEFAALVLGFINSELNIQGI